MKISYNQINTLANNLNNFKLFYKIINKINLLIPVYMDKTNSKYKDYDDEVLIPVYMNSKYKDYDEDEDFEIAVNVINYLLKNNIVTYDFFEIFEGKNTIKIDCYFKIINSGLLLKLL